MSVRQYWAMSGFDVLNHFQSSERGLSNNQVTKWQAKYGRNEIIRKERRTSLAIFISQFTNPQVLILIGAIVVAAFLGELIDTIVISCIVVMNGVLEFFQEYRSEKALERT